MTELIITRGLPASGKTTWARAWVAEDEEHRARVNRDDLRFNLFGRYWPVPEDSVTHAQRAAVTALLKKGRSVVVDDTNLKQKVARDWAKLAVEHGVFFTERWFVGVALDELIRRDAARERSVGEDVIRGMQMRYLNKGSLQAVSFPPQAETPLKYVPDDRLPPAYIVDLDGTLAKMNGRSPYDWTRVGEDALVEPVKQLIVDLTTGNGLGIVVMSGRDHSCRDQTEDWLALHGVFYDALLMRAADDRRADDVVKSELFFRHVAPNWNVRGAIDDRNRVVAMWRSIGLMCAQVAEGDF